MVLTQACTNQNDNIRFVKSDIIKIPLPPKVDGNLVSFFYYDHGKSKLYVLDNRYYISIFDLDQNAVIDRFETQLKDGRVKSIFVKNEDSIYLMASKDYSLKLLNKKGKVLKTYYCWNFYNYENKSFGEAQLNMLPIINRWSKKKDLPNLGLLNITASPIHPLYLGGSSLYTGLQAFLTFVSVNTPKEDLKKAYLSTKALLKVDLNDTLLTFTNYCNWPEKYYNNGFFNEMSYSSVSFIDETDHLVSFPIVDELYLYQDTILKMKIPVKSKYIDHTDPTTEDTRNSPELRTKYRVEQPYYASVLYDKYRKLIYRVVAHRQEYENSNGTVNDVLDKNWSIIILDSDFNYLDEIKMEKGKYNFNTILVVKEGLLISTFNKSNKDFNPNEYSFQLFQVKK